MSNLSKKETFLIKGLVRALAVTVVQYLLLILACLSAGLLSTILWWNYSNTDAVHFIGIMLLVSMIASFAIIYPLHVKIQRGFKNSLRSLKLFSNYI